MKSLVDTQGTESVSRIISEIYPQWGENQPFPWSEFIDVQERSNKLISMALIVRTVAILEAYLEECAGYCATLNIQVIEKDHSFVEYDTISKRISSLLGSNAETVFRRRQHELHCLLAFLVVRHRFGHSYGTPSPVLHSLVSNQSFEDSWKAVEATFDGTIPNFPNLDENEIALTPVHTVFATIISNRIVAACDEQLVAHLLKDHNLLILCVKGFLRNDHPRESFKERVKRFNYDWEALCGGSAIHTHNMPRKLKEINLFDDFRNGCTF